MRSGCLPLLWTLFLFNLHAGAQESTGVINLSDKDGLSNRWVTHIFQDSKDFMWFSTIDGLNRYDGNEFTVFRPSEFDTTANDWIWWVEESPDGKIRMSTKTGQAILDPAAHRLRFFRNNNWMLNDDTASFHLLGAAPASPSEPYWKNRKPDFDYYDSKNQIDLFKIAEDGGLDRVGTLKIPLDDKLIIFKASRFRIWFLLGRSGYWLADLEKGTFKNFGQDGKKPWQGKPYPDLFDARRRFWYPLPGDEAFGFAELPPKSAELEKIYLDNLNNIWLLTGGKEGYPLLKFDMKIQQWQQICLLPADAVFSIYEDREGTIWIGYQLGLIKIVARKKLFQQLLSKPFLLENLPPASHSCRKIVEDEAGNIFVTDEHSLFKIVPGADEAVEIQVKMPVHPGLSSKIEPKDIFIDKEGALWVADFTGLYRLNRITGATEKFYPSPIWISSIKEDAWGRIWLTHDKGVILFDKQTGKYLEVDYRGFHFTKNGLMSEDGKTLWAFHNKGLVRINCLKLTATEINLYKENRDQRQIMFHGGWMWIASSKGLVKVDTARWTQITYNTKHGLPADFVYSMLPDGDFIWSGTGGGLCKFNTHNLEVQNYFVEDGLSHNEFNSSSVLKTKDGRLIMGGLNGLNIFRPDELEKAGSPRPNLFWMKFSKYAGSKHKPFVLTYPYLDTAATLKLHPADKSFFFHFALTSYRDQRNNKFSFYLEGLEEGWHPFSNSPVAFYPNIPPGEYTFRVKAIDPSGQESSNQLAIRVVMPSFWYQRWWAVMLYVLVLGGGSFFIYLHLLRQKLEHAENLKLRELDAFKSRFFANISHEFRTPLTLILGQIESSLPGIGESKIKERLLVAHRNGKRLLRLVNQLLDLSKLEAGSMALHTVSTDLVLFLKNIFYSFESLANQKNISLEFQSEETSLSLDFDVEKMEKVFFNLLSNAFKFTANGGQISMHIRSSTGPAGFVEISVRDTGAGIPPDRLPFIFDRFYQADNSPAGEQSGTGIGLALVKEFTELHHGKVHVKSREGTGSEFIIRLPFSKAGDSPAQQEVPITSDNTFITDALEAEHPEMAGAVVTAPKVFSIKAENALQLLVIEDNPDVRFYLCDHLAEAGYSVSQAENGEEGLAYAQTYLPDLIITDVMMPRMDGFEFSRRLRADERTSHIPVIMLTAKAGEEDKIAGLQTGVDDYLTKPFSSRELLARVSNLISLRQILRKRFSKSLNIRPSEVSVISADQAFLKKVIMSIETHLGEENYGVELLSREVGMSQSQLNRKLHALIDQSTGKLIRSMRLHRAAELLKKKTANISEIAYQVGFGDAANFTRSFRQQFGCSPSEYQSENS